jgi:hypothetical protein
VTATERGRVDTNATEASQNVGLKLEDNPSSDARVFGRGGYFHEKRDNGKASTIDGTMEGNGTDGHLDMFASVQNLFDQVYYVGTLPTTIGSPRLVRAGIRLRLGS